LASLGSKGTDYSIIEKSEDYLKLKEDYKKLEQDFLQISGIATMAASLHNIYQVWELHREVNNCNTIPSQKVCSVPAAF